MDEFEKYLTELFKKCDFSAGTEEFREELLGRCLAIIEEQEQQKFQENDEEVRALDDSDLELLAAAGDITAIDAFYQQEQNHD